MKDLQQHKRTPSPPPINGDGGGMNTTTPPQDLPDVNTVTTPSPMDTNTAGSLKRMVLAYFAGWTIYASDAQKLAEVDYTKLTHLTYAFAKIDADSGRIQI